MESLTHFLSDELYIYDSQNRIVVPSVEFRRWPKRWEGNIPSLSNEIFPVEDFVFSVFKKCNSTLKLFNMLASTLLGHRNSFWKKVSELSTGGMPKYIQKPYIPNRACLN